MYLSIKLRKDSDCRVELCNEQGELISVIHIDDIYSMPTDEDADDRDKLRGGEELILEVAG